MLFFWKNPEKMYHGLHRNVKQHCFHVSTFFSSPFWPFFQNSEFASCNSNFFIVYKSLYLIIFFTTEYKNKKVIVRIVRYKPRTAIKNIIVGYKVLYLFIFKFLDRNKQKSFLKRSSKIDPLVPSSEPPTFANRIAKKSWNFTWEIWFCEVLTEKMCYNESSLYSLLCVFHLCLHCVSLHLFGGSHTSDIVSFVSRLPCVNVLMDWNTLMPYKLLNGNARKQLLTWRPIDFIWL